MGTCGGCSTYFRLASWRALWYKYLRTAHAGCACRVVSWCKGSTRDFDSLCLGSNPGETSKANLLTVENVAVRRFSSTALKIFLKILSKKWPNFSFETKNRHTNNSDLEYRGRSIEKERTL